VLCVCTPYTALSAFLICVSLIDGESMIRFVSFATLALLASHCVSAHFCGGAVPSTMLWSPPPPPLDAAALAVEAPTPPCGAAALAPPKVKPLEVAAGVAAPGRADAPNDDPAPPDAGAVLGNANPVDAPIAEPLLPAAPNAEPVLAPNAEPVLPNADPVLPNAEPVDTPIAEPVLAPNADPVLPNADPVLPNAEPEDAPNAEPVLAPNADPVLPPVVGNLKLPPRSWVEAADMYAGVDSDHPVAGCASFAILIL